MYEKIPVILTADKLLDRSFRKTNKILIVDRNVSYKKKKTIIAKTESFSDTLTGQLEQYVKKFPSIDNMHPFYQELLSLHIDNDKLKRSLGAVDWARKTCQMIYKKQSRALKKTKNIDFLMTKQKEIYGRMSSVVKQVNSDLVRLADAQNTLKKLPEIQDLSTVVIAGYPNVGKSSILRSISHAKPQVAQYPFTTKEIHIGHITRKEKHIKTTVQLIDTPGLFDRPLEDRNLIEKQAIAALEHLADIIVFVLDPSEICGYLLDDQKKLLSQMKKMFKKSEFIIAENKSDIKKTKTRNIKLSCNKQEGFEKLIDRIFEKI